MFRVFSFFLATIGNDLQSDSSESVAQLVEHRTFNAVVAGSSPARLTIFLIRRCHPTDGQSEFTTSSIPVTVSGTL